MANKVGVGKGNTKAAAYLYTAPEGTPLPTDAKTALPAEYTALALVSDEGVTFSVDSDSSDIKDWGGRTVQTVRSGRTETAKFSLIETNMAAMKQVYGESAVSGTEDKFTIDHAAAEAATLVYVWEVLLSDTQIKRIVAPRGKMSELDDITYAPGDAVAYPITIKCLEGTEGFSVREFVETVDSTYNPGGGGEPGGGE